MNKGKEIGTSEKTEAVIKRFSKTVGLFKDKEAAPDRCFFVKAVPKL